ncbi:hypothetical protein HC931_27340 [Candidatus Gracilibacteria bacterium]|nr:hypothetical protein [Candidatus Gracilibacteria bacterium]
MRSHSHSLLGFGWVCDRSRVTIEKNIERTCDRLIYNKAVNGEGISFSLPSDITQKRVYLTQILHSLH